MTNVLVANGWSANGPDNVKKQVEGLTPTSVSQRDPLSTVLNIAQYIFTVIAPELMPDWLKFGGEIQPDVVLSDLKMPGRSGFELLADIQDFGRSLGRTIPVIAMTAYRYKQAETAAAGFRMHLEKPFTPDQLLATIDRALHQ